MNNIINFNKNCVVSLIINEVGRNFKSNVESYYRSKSLYKSNFDVSINDYMEMVFEELEDIGIVLNSNINFNDNYYNNFYRLFMDVKNDKYFSNYRLGKVVIDFIINSNNYSNCCCYYNESNFKNSIDREYRFNLFDNNDKVIMSM